MTPTVDIRLPRLTADQDAIRRAARRFNALVAGRRYGKTTLGVDLATDPVLDGAPVAWVSMSYKNFTEVWRAMSAVLAPITTATNKAEFRIETLTGGAFEAWTWRNIVSMRGRKYRRVLIDEAAFIPDLMAEQGGYPDVVRPTLIDLQGDAWFLSSPNGRNDFHALYERGQSPDWPEWASWRRTTADNPRIAPEEIDALRRELGPKLAEQEIDAAFVDLASLDTFLPDMALWDACRDDLPPLGPHEPCVIALDAAESNDTFGCVIVSAHPRQPERIAVRHARGYVPDGAPLDFDAIEVDIRDLVRRYAVQQIAYDPMLLGQTIRRLRTGPRPVAVACEPFPQGNARLEADKALLDAIQQRRVAHDGGEALRQHIANANRKTDADGRRLRIVKRSYPLKIDLAVALSMAHQRMGAIRGLGVVRAPAPKANVWSDL
jgi:hypothetical protein